MLEFAFAPVEQIQGQVVNFKIRGGACTNAEANGEEGDGHEKPDGHESI